MCSLAIVCVDDEPAVLESLKEQLKRHFGKDYYIEVAENGEEAIEIVKELQKEGIEIPLIISDQIMPGMTGDKLLSQIHAQYPETLKILLTGQATIEAVGNAVNSAKLYRYIAKPWDEVDLSLTVAEGVRSYLQGKQINKHHRDLEQVNQELQQLNATLEEKVAQRTHKLAQTEAELQGIFAAMTELVLVFDAQGKYLKIASNNAVLLYQPPETLLGKTLHEIFAPEQADTFLGCIQQALERKEAVSLEYSLIIDGQKTWFAANVSPISADLVVWVARDISNRHLLEEKLRTSEQKIRAVFEAMTDIVLVIDQQGGIEVAPTKPNTLFKPETDLIDLTIKQFFLGERKEIWWGKIKQVLETQQTVNFDYSLPVGNREVWFAVSISPMLNHSVIWVARNIDQRKQAETVKTELIHSLQQSEGCLSTIVKTTSEALIVLDIGGKGRFANPAAESLLGKPAAAILGQRIDLPTNLNGSVQIEMQRPSGELIIAEMRSAQIVWQNEAACLLSLRNVTERLQAEQALRASQQRLSFLLQNMPLAVIEWNTNTEIVTWNPAAEAIFGYSAAESIGKRGAQLLVAEDNRSQVEEIYQQLLTQKGGNHSINANLTKSGKTIICQWYNTPLLDEQGTVIGIASIAVDITEHQQRELLEKTQNIILKMVAQGWSLSEILLALTIQVDQLMPNLFSCILLMAEDNRHLRFCAGPKIPPAWVQLIDPLPIGPTSSVCGAAAYFGKRAIAENIATHPWCTLFKDQATSLGLKTCWSEPILSDTGKVLGTFAIYFTEMRSPEPRELEMLESLARLASLVIERKQSEVALKLAKEAAETANHAKSDFLARMSHELRTPLNAILGFSQILDFDESLTPEQRENLRIINRSGEHLLELINDILSMSKIEAGQIALNENSFDLLLLLDSIEQMLRLKANAKSIEFIFERSTDLPRYVKTDESKLRQVLINLLSNAIKFTKQGKVTLRVRVEPSKHNVLAWEHGNWETPLLYPAPRLSNASYSSVEYLVFQVEDTGQGIAPEELSTVFEPFVQTRTGRQSGEGTGLGLAISRQFVRLMGGDISISSILGIGSIFTFEIQICLASAEDVPTKLCRRRVISLEAHQTHNRILVVEDVAENRQLLVKLLKPLGFVVCEAENGQEAIALWQSWQPNLILMDIWMPVMNGYEATAIIKQSPQGQNTVIIALTASAFDEQREAMLAIGCDDFLAKPFREDLLLTKIADHLKVNYLYAQEEQSTNIPLATQPLELTRSVLSVMPNQWLQELHQAALLMDDQLVSELIKKIPEDQILLAKSLTNLVSNFRLDIITKLTTNDGDISSQT
ncbi:PAS domain S-box protein [Lyngbya aestuarii]|uniref:PAS domain S-box protein n=1 Tax=Lyngbya aestuarii TaxID=118322 RepID=UPI00403D961E